MEKKYQEPKVEVVVLYTDQSILESSLTGSRGDYEYSTGWED